MTGPGRPLKSERWAGAVDAVGATLPYVLRTLRIGASVASSGNAGGADLATTVFPFILRGVSLLGMIPCTFRSHVAASCGTGSATDLRPRELGVHCREVTLDTLDDALDGIIAGESRGRWIVRIGD